MIIQLSDFILEQEISTASASDIIVEQTLAEFEVSCALVEAYTKQLTMLQYADPDSSFYQEAESGEKNDGFFKRIWEALKKAWKSFTGFFVNLWKKFIGLFKKKKNGTSIIDDTIENLSQIPIEQQKDFKVKVKGTTSQQIDFLLDSAEDFEKMVSYAAELIKGMENDDDNNTLRNLSIKIEEIDKRIRSRKNNIMFRNPNSGAKIELDYQETKKLLEDLKSKMSKLPDITKLEEIAKMNISSMDDIFTPSQNVDQEKLAELRQKRADIVNVSKDLTKIFQTWINEYGVAVEAALVDVEHAYTMTLKFAKYKEQKKTGKSAGEFNAERFGKDTDTNDYATALNAKV